MKNSTYFITFVAGAVIGSLATWQFTKKMYERIAQEEIDSVKETFTAIRGRDKNNDETLSETAKSKNELTDIMSDPVEESDKIEYSKIIDANGYGEEKEEVKNMNKRPYVIKPDEFDELDGYETRTLTYYSDGYLTDAIDNEIIDDVEELVGFDALNHFGEYEEDSVYVRNDIERCDYEILKDDQKFADIICGN